MNQKIKQHLSNEADLISSFFTIVRFIIAANSTINIGDRDNNGFRYATIFTLEHFGHRGNVIAMKRELSCLKYPQKARQITYYPVIVTTFGLLYSYITPVIAS